MKVAMMTPIGKEMQNAKDNIGLAFDQVKNLVFMITGLDSWKNDTGALLYRKLVMGVVKQKDPEKKKQFMRDQIKPWFKLYNAYREDILKEDFSFLTDSSSEPIKMVTGNSKNAILPLGEAYIWLLKNDANQVDDMQAKLFILFKNLVGDNSSDRKALDSICEQFEIEEDQATGNVIANIVSKVKGQMGPGKDGQPSMDNIMPIVQAIFQDGNLQNNMGALAESVMSGKMGIPDLINHVQRSVNGNNQKEAEQKISDKMDKEEDS